MHRRPFLVALALSLFMASVAATANSPAGEAPEAKVKAVAATAPVNLNTATAAELEALPGIGPATARRIIEYREQHGSFKKVEELMNIKGIGEKSFLKLKDQVTVATPKK